MIQIRMLLKKQSDQDLPCFAILTSVLLIPVLIINIFICENKMKSVRNFGFLLQVEQRTSEIYSFLTQAAPFGTMLDTTVHSVIDKMSNKSSPIPKTQKVIILAITKFSYKYTCSFKSSLFTLSLCLLGNFACFFLTSADFFQNQLFQKIISGIPSECQTVWIQIRPDILLILIWVQTVCKSYQQITLVSCLYY